MNLPEAKMPMINLCGVFMASLARKRLGTRNRGPATGYDAGV